MVAIGNYLNGIETATSDGEEDDASPMRFSDGNPAAGLPAYAEAAACRPYMAARPRTPSLDSDISMSESERLREARRKHTRYVLDDEAGRLGCRERKFVVRPRISSP